MTGPRYDALASKLIARTQTEERDPPAAADRAAAIAVIEGAIRRKNRRRLLGRLTMAAAAVAILGFGASRLSLGYREPGPTAQVPAAPAIPAITVVGHPTGGGATVVETGNPAPLSDGRSLAAGSRISAHSGGHVVLSVSTGTQLTVEEGGEFSIVDSGPNEVFALHAGAVRADVAKLVAGQRFIIRTPDAEVEVHGTSFRVAMTDPNPTCEGGTVTRVVVYEGVVTVRHADHEARVPAGESWPTGCVTSPAPGAPASPKNGDSVTRPKGAESQPAHDEPKTPASVLKEQNDLFARAFAARKRGATGEAIEGFETFLARYPSSSLSESARAQRMSLLRAVDPAKAASAAEQYLARYPSGFARAEAEAILRK